MIARRSYIWILLIQIMKRLLPYILLITAAATTYAQNSITPITDGITTIEYVDRLTDEQLDTIDVKKKLSINDYTLIGIQYGAGLSRFSFNPKQENDGVILPYNIGITFTKYGKMFGYMPYFGFQTGLFFAQDAYQFTYNEEYDYTSKIENSEKAVIDVIEVPVMFQFHYDLWNFKIMANLGCYGGYRLAIHRFPGESGNVKDEMVNSFAEHDRRWDYGLKGGVGFGLVFDPIEIHFQASYKHSFSSLYEPNHYSEYYYRFAYPSNIVVSVGIQYHLTKRSGRTKAEIKQMAMDMVYNPELFENADTDSKNRTRNNRK